LEISDCGTFLIYRLTRQCAKALEITHPNHFHPEPVMMNCYILTRHWCINLCHIYYCSTTKHCKSKWHINAL